MKSKKAKPAYDFANVHRGNMTLLVDKTNKRSLMLTDWPTSLIAALEAGVLCGKAEEEALVLQSSHKRWPHPWRNYPSKLTQGDVHHV